jgi:hypothetical protein
MSMRIGTFLVLALLPLHAAQDLDEVFAKADKLLDQAKEGYENGKSKASGELLTAAAFKREEAKLKYLAVQEVAKGDLQQLAVDRLKEVNQLSKLLNEAKLTLTRKSPPDPSLKPAESPAATPAEPTPSVKMAPTLNPAPAPIPDLTRQREAEKAIKDVFKTDYAKRSPQDIQAFARKLLQQALESQDDPAAHFVLLRESRDLALQCGDLETALSAISTLGQWFQFDAVAAKTAALTKAATTLRGPDTALLLTKAYLQVVEEAIAAAQFDSAAAAGVKAEASAKAINDPTLLVRVQAVSREAAQIQKEANAVKVHMKTLQNSPDDPSANLAVGRFLCFAAGDWEQGLLLLSKGTDGDLKALALRDLARPTDGPEPAALEDAWWALSEKESGATGKQRLRSRAWTWCKLALPGAMGLAKVKIEARLRETGTFVRPPGKPTHSETVGGTGGGDFEDIARTEGALLVGLKYTLVPWGTSTIVKSIAPIYSDGLNRSEGRQYGEASAPVLEVVAKPGYAVGSISAKGGTRLDSIKIVFMRIAGTSLDPRDSYSSKLIGGAGGGAEVKFGGDGAYVIGICGKCGVDIDCFGIVQLK